MMGLLDYDIELAKQAIQKIPGLLNDVTQGVRDKFGMNNARNLYAMRNLDGMAGGDLQANRAANNKQFNQKMINVGLDMNPAAVGQIVWHGSPHKFDKFDMSKIGTGEGAQAYGHGLYMAESPDVAGTYKASNSASAKFRYNGKELDPVKDEIKQSVAYYLSEFKGDKGAIRAMFKPSYFTDNPSGKKFGKLLDSMDYNKLDNGQLYKVDIPDEAVARFLDWDKPLSQQAPEVQAALQKAGIDTAVKSAILSAENLGSEGFGIRNAKSGNLLSGRFSSESDANDFIVKQLGFVSPNKNGNHGYEKLEQIYGSQPEATAFLKQQGIPGIRYLDGGSRGAGQGSSNFVIFDDQMPRILEINGNPTGNQAWKPGEWKGLLSTPKTGTVKITSWNDFQKQNPHLDANEAYKIWKNEAENSILNVANDLSERLRSSGIEPSFGGGLLDSKSPFTYTNGIDGISSYMNVPVFGEVRISDHMRGSGLGNDRTFGNADDAFNAIKNKIVKIAEDKTASNKETQFWRDSLGISEGMGQKQVMDSIKSFIEKNPQTGQAKDFGWWKYNRLGLGHKWDVVPLEVPFNPFK